MFGLRLGALFGVRPGLTVLPVLGRASGDTAREDCLFCRAEQVNRLAECECVIDGAGPVPVCAEHFEAQRAFRG